MSFNRQLYQQVWQRLNQSRVIANTNVIPLFPLLVFNSLDSSNTKLWELIDIGDSTPLGVIALSQTAGKGQWGHSWVSTTGGLYLSVALDLDLAIEDNPHLVMATAWGIARVLRYYRLPVTIKWSNDLILERRKLGGIKIETRNLRNKIAKAVVGVNWRNTVPEMGINLESYYQERSHKYIASLEELAAITAYGIVLGYQYYLTVGIEQLLPKYLSILNSLRKQVMIDNCSGEVIGVTTDGKLRVKLRSPGATTEIDLAPGQISLGY